MNGISHWRLGLVLGVAFGGGFVAWLLAPELMVGLRGAFAVTVALFLPGYAIVRLAMGSRRLRLKQAVFASGLSIALLALGGLLLDAFGALTATGWAIYLAGITLPALALVLLADRAWRPAVARLGGRLPAPRQADAFAMAGMLSVAALMIARAGAASYREFPVTEFWMLPQSGGCCANALTIGIRNLEGRAAVYDVEVMLDGQAAARLPRIVLKPGETWLRNIDLPATAGAGRRAEAWLFRDGDHRRIYRRVWADAGSGRIAAGL